MRISTTGLQIQGRCRGSQVNYCNELRKAFLLERLWVQLSSGLDFSGSIRSTDLCNFIEQFASYYCLIDLFCLLRCHVVLRHNNRTWWEVVVVAGSGIVVVFFLFGFLMLFESQQQTTLFFVQEVDKVLELCWGPKKDMGYKIGRVVLQ